MVAGSPAGTVGSIVGARVTRTLQIVVPVQLSSNRLGSVSVCLSGSVVRALSLMSSTTCADPLLTRNEPPRPESRCTSITKVCCGPTGALYARLVVVPASAVMTKLVPAGERLLGAVVVGGSG